MAKRAERREKKSIRLRYYFESAACLRIRIQLVNENESEDEKVNSMWSFFQLHERSIFFLHFTISLVYLLFPVYNIFRIFNISLSLSSTRSDNKSFFSIARRLFFFHHNCNLHQKECLQWISIPLESYGWRRKVVTSKPASDRLECRRLIEKKKSESFTLDVERIRRIDESEKRSLSSGVKEIFKFKI